VQLKVVDNFEAFKNTLAIALVHNPQLLINSVQLQFEIVHAGKNLQTLPSVFVMDGFDVSLNLYYSCISASLLLA
jgi:hypothetical protein